MSVYLLAPILLQAAPAVDQRFAVERAVEAQSSGCCATNALSYQQSDFQLNQAASGPSANPPHGATMALAAASPSVAQESESPSELDHRYSFRDFREEAKTIKWRFAGAAAAITLTGFANWDWGSSHFRFKSEGWFGKNTASLGMDKLGHAYSTYVLTEFFSDGIEKSFDHKRSGSYTAAILAMGLMTYIEVFDGFSKEHGFSHEDLLVDAAGALFSVARRSVPGLREKIDFRLLYIPSRSTWQALSCFPEPHCDDNGQTARSPITDYSGQRYLLAFKLSGFERFAHTPLRFLELHAGYYARGFTKEEEDRGDPLKRRLFAGFGLNVSELLFPGRRRGLGGAAKWALQYLQIPYTAVHSN